MFHFFGIIFSSPIAFSKLSYWEMLELVWKGLLSCKTVLSVFLLANSRYPKDWYIHSVCFRKGGEEGEKGVGGELANLLPLHEVCNYVNLQLWLS